MTRRAYALLGALMSCCLVSETAFAETELLAPANPQSAATIVVTPGGSEPPASVPPVSKAPVFPLTFAVSPLGFTTQPMSFSTTPMSLPTSATVADISVKPEGKSLRFTLAADVLFDFDKAKLRPEADMALRKLMMQLTQRGSHIRLKVEGHTDGKGTDDYNDQLSRRRALSVQAWLVSNGSVPANAITTVGFGKKQPVAPNVKSDGSDDAEGRRKNRRVEIVVTSG